MCKKIFSAIIFAVVLSVLTGCSTKERGTVNELRYGFTTEPATFDPLNPANTADGRSILFNIFEGLVKPDTEGRMTPSIAESWTIEEDGLVYNFLLRENILFHDGSVLTSEDVKFSLDIAISAGFIGLERIKEVIATDERNIIITLTEPDFEFLPYLTIGIVKAGNTDRERNIIGTGPFLVENYRTQQDLVLRKFDDYRLSGIPHLEKVTIVFFANSDAQMVALRGGSIDGARITGSLAAQLNPDQFDIVHSNSAAVQLLALNNAAPGLDDIRVRFALSYAINVQEIIDAAFFGFGEPSGSPIIPGLSLYYEEGLTYPYRPDTAVYLLEQAGFGNGEFSLEITVPSNFTMHVDTAQVIAEQLQRVGINTSIKLVDWATWLSDVYFGRNYQATIISLDSPVVSPRSFLSRYRTGAGDNFINYSYGVFDRVFNSILRETDEARRIEFYKEAQQVIASTAASVFIQDIVYFMAFRGGRFGGALDYPLYVDDFSVIYRVNEN